jgi:hypothetical protein
MMSGGDSSGNPLREAPCDRKEYGMDGFVAYVSADARTYPPKPMTTSTASACSNGPNLNPSRDLSGIAEMGKYRDEIKVW